MAKTELGWPSTPRLRFYSSLVRIWLKFLGVGWGDFGRSAYDVWIGHGWLQIRIVRRGDGFVMVPDFL